MRPLIFLLIFGNIVVFALSAGWIGGGREAVAVAPESHQPLSPDRIKIVSRGDPPTIPKPVRQCIEWRELSGAQAAKIEEATAGQRGLALNRDETRAASSRYWVFIPAPKGGKPAAEKKAAEVKALGVTGFKLVQDGASDGWAISLGTYPGEAAATAALAEFRKTGIRSAQQALQSESPAHFRIRLSGLPEALSPLRKLADIPPPLDCPAAVTAATAAPTAPVAAAAAEKADVAAAPVPDAAKP